MQVLEGRRVFKHLTVEENLKVGTLTRRGVNLKEELDRIYHYFPRLAELRHRLAGYCSGGEQQMIAIGRALLAKPRLLLLDEPSLGLAPLLVREIFDIVARVNAEEGVTVLVVEQNARVALSIAHYGYIMESGRIVLGGTGRTSWKTPTSRSSTWAWPRKGEEELQGGQGLQAAQALHVSPKGPCASGAWRRK